MAIKGIPAEEAYHLHPDQWINLWLIDCDDRSLEFYCPTQVRDLGEAIGEHDITEFVLEPITATGEAMSLQQALERQSI